MSALNRLFYWAFAPKRNRFVRSIAVLTALIVALIVSPTVRAATLTVTNLNDSGAGSLRQEVIDAAPGDTITFAVTGTITLTSGEIPINKSLNIVGPGPGNLIISGNNTSRIFTIAKNTVVTISDVTLANGNGSTGGAHAISNLGTTTISNSVISNNGGEGTGTIGNSHEGVLTISNSIISNNTVTNGAGSAVNTAGVLNITGSLLSNNSSAIVGGAVYNATDANTTTITGSCIVNNTTNAGFDIHRDGGTLNADNNWWGVPTGPNTGGETTNVFVASFLTSPPPPCGAPPPTLSVTIDIKPGSFPNSINPRSKGKIPVAILTTDTFDATTVDPTTVLFGATGSEAAPVHVALEDVDGDGDIDLILHFSTQATGIVCGDTSASLTGDTVSSEAIEGSDSIKTVGCK